MAKKKAVEATVDASGKLFMPEPVRMSLASINPAPYNPRTITKEKLASLKASILKHGMVLTLVVQNRSEAYGERVLIGGHQRIRAMREICEERGWPIPEFVFAVVLDVTDAQAKQLNISLNAIEGDFDPYKVGEMFASILPTMTTDDVIATGFDRKDLDAMVALTMPPPIDPESTGDEVRGFAKAPTLSVEFENAVARDEAKALLQAMAKSTGRNAGSLVLEGLQVMQTSRRTKKKA